MENKLTLEHIAPYLPYGLTFLSGDGEIKEIDTLSTTSINIKDRGTTYGMYADLDDIKPILRPMSDLYEWMPETENSYYGQAKEETGFDLDTDFSFDVDIEYSGTRRFALLPILSAINFLLKHHFDIFGLIDAGLAIDINTLQK